MVEDIIFKKLTEEPDSIRAKSRQAVGTPLTEQQSDDLRMEFNALRCLMPVLDNTRDNPAFKPISSHRKVIGKPIVLAKRTVRKLLKWYIEPITDQQTRFNNAATSCVNSLSAISEKLSRQNNMVIERQSIAEDDHAYLSGRLDTLSAFFKRIDVVEAIAKQNDERILEIEENIGGGGALEARLSGITSLLKEKEERLQSIEAQTGEIAALEARLSGITSLLKEKEERLQSIEAQLDSIRAIDPTVFEADKEQFFNKRTNSQAGEDSIAAYIMIVLGYKPSEITYLDLGANHARDMSNTYYFYRHGARGVLVEANPGLIAELSLLRSKDVIINRCIAENDDEDTDFYILSGDGLSTMCRTSAENAVAVNSSLSIKRKLTVKTITINRILRDYFTEAPVLLSVDVEGCEMDILRSYDFEHYRPLVIIIEVIPYSPKLVIERKNNEIIEFLQGQGYAEFAFTGINSIFIDKQRLGEGVSA